MNTDRREFLKSSMMAAAALAVAAPEGAERPGPGSDFAPRIIDSNVHIHGWPFRKLKYGDTDALVAKLRSHRVEEAWAGSFDALFHKHLDAVNRKLADACRDHANFLLPFGTVNPAWPDWQEELRRCHEEYGMAGIRLYPGYQNYPLEHPEFGRLVAEATDRDMIIQIAVDMEDERVHHPRVHVPAVDVLVLPEVLREVPGARVQLLNPFRHVRGDRLVTMVNETNVVFDVSNLEGDGGIERVIAGTHWFLPGSVPAGRLLFGTHAPFFPAENALLKLFESQLSREQLKMVMHDNAASLRRPS